MGKLKLTSIRLEEQTLDAAFILAKRFTFLSPSDIIRLAIWIGFKLITPRSALKLYQLMAEENFNGDIVTLQDVLRTAEDQGETKHEATV